MSPNPEQTPGISDKSRAVVADLLRGIPADEVTVWFHCADEDALRAVYNPSNPDIIGLIQPVSRGLISQVLVTGLPLLEHDVRTRSDHDPGIDSQLGKRTRSLMAAPVALAGGAPGVISAVQLSDGQWPEGFQDRDLARLERAAEELGKTMTCTGSAPS